ncbi:myotubularin-related protein 8 isoform X1, partial [Tachysurus ichikawai]
KEEELYAFLYSPQQGADERRHGWDLISMNADFSRMGLPNEFWEISDLNSNFELCSTYPSALGIPKCASVATVTGSAKFRSRNRLPALSYYHKDTKTNKKIDRELCRERETGV